MKILVTGCSGYVGRAAVSHLLSRNFEVRGIDLVDPEVTGLDFQSVDLFDLEALGSHLADIDAILHLAGNPRPTATGTDVFNLNCAGTFNIYAAASAAGVSRVVVASSIHAIGYFFTPKPFELSYLPVDEAHPKTTTDSYSFSKQITEDIGDYFWRRERISSASLRFGAGWHNPGVSRRQEIDALVAAKERVAELAALPIEESTNIIHQAQTLFDELRQDRIFEKPSGRVTFPDSPDFKLMWMRHTLFSYVDLGDACEAMELSLTAGFEGSHPLFVVHPQNILNADAATLARMFYPTLPTQSSLQGNQTFYAWEKAASLIGFRAQTDPDQLLIE